MEKKSVLIFSSVVFLMLMGVLAAAVPSGHAQLVGTVCIQPTGVTGCTTTPPVITGAAGTSVTVNINVNDSDSLGTAEISVVTDPTILNPTSISSTGTVVAVSPLTVVDCINGVPQAGASCNPYDVAGVASLGITSLGSLTIPPTTGLLFTITYSILTTTSGTPISFVSDPVNCAGQSIAGTNDCVLIAAGFQVNPEHAQTATFSNAPTADFTISANPSSLIVQPGDRSSSIIILQSHGFTGTVTLTVNVSPRLDNGVHALVRVSHVRLKLNGERSIRLIVSADDDALLGEYSVMVTGTSGTLSHSVIVKAMVTNPGEENTLILSASSHAL